MKKSKSNPIFQARVFPSKRNDEQHVLVYKLLKDADYKNATAGFLTLANALESDVLKDYIGASEYSDVLGCDVIKFSLPFALELSHIPDTRTWTNPKGVEITSYISIDVDDIVDSQDL